MTLRTTPTLTSASSNAVRISFSTSSTSASVSRPLPRIFLMTPSRREDNESNIARQAIRPTRPPRLEARDPIRVRNPKRRPPGSPFDDSGPSDGPELTYAGLPVHRLTTHTPSAGPELTNAGYWGGQPIE